MEDIRDRLFQKVAEKRFRAVLTAERAGVLSGGSDEIGGSVITDDSAWQPAKILNTITMDSIKQMVCFIFIFIDLLCEKCLCSC